MRNGERGGVWMQWTEAASLLGIRQGQILRLIEDKRLPAEETSAGIVMIRRADVERLRDEPRERRPSMLPGN
jgi:excisionase family DNA binding protein